MCQHIKHHWHTHLDRLSDDFPSCSLTRTLTFRFRPHFGLFLIFHEDLFVLLPGTERSSSARNINSLFLCIIRNFSCQQLSLVRVCENGLRHRFLPFCFQGILSFNTIRTVSVYQGESLWKNTHLDMTAKTNCSTKEFTPEIVGKCHFHRQYHNNNTSPKNSGWWEKNWEISDWNRDKCTEYHILKLQNYYQKSGACFMKEYI